jgi:hypothetical protein
LSEHVSNRPAAASCCSKWGAQASAVKWAPAAASCLPRRACSREHAKS